MALFLCVLSQKIPAVLGGRDALGLFEHLGEHPVVGPDCSDISAMGRDVVSSSFFACSMRMFVKYVRKLTPISLLNSWLMYCGFR